MNATGWLGALEGVFGWLLAASWQASVLALIVLVLQAVLRGRLNPRWRYALWLLVILRLVMPALPESALSLFQFAPIPSPYVLTPVTEPLFTTTAPTLPVAVETVTEPARPLTLYSLLALGWLAGALVLLALTWEANRRFARQVARSPGITDPVLLDLFRAAKAELGVRRPIRLVENGQVQSPAIMGLFSPTLLLPGGVRDRFDATELRLIFLHELAHLKRGDVIVQGLIALLQILHWFNPVLWFAFRRMRIDREPATDALVLSRAGEAEKERYGLMLIKLLEHFNQRHSLPTLVGILEDKDQFKRRFSLIAKFTRGAYGWSVLGVLLVGILSVACLTKSKAAQPPNSPTSADGKGDVESGPKRAVDFHITLVEVDEKAYERQAQAMDEAVRNGNIHFFDHSPWIARSADIILNAGQSGWFSEGFVETYVASVSKKKTTILSANAVFLGLNANFTWSKNGTSFNSAWQVTAPVGFDNVNASSDAATLDVPNPYLAPRFHITTFKDNDWDMEPGKEHGFWVGETYGWAKRMSQVGGPWASVVPVKPKSKSSYDTSVANWQSLINSQSPTRLAVFMTAKPVPVSVPKADAGTSATNTNTQAIQDDQRYTQGTDVLRDKGEILIVKAFLVPAGFFKATPADHADIRPELIAHGIAFPANATATYLGPADINLAAAFKIVVRNTPEQLDLLAKLIDQQIKDDPVLDPRLIPPEADTGTNAPDQSNLAGLQPDGSVAIPKTGGPVVAAPKGSIEISLKVVEVNEDDYQANKEKIDVAVEKADIGFFNHLKGVSLLSMPSVSTKPGTVANIDIVREFSYPTSFDETGKVVSAPSGRTMTSTPPTPREFATKEIGVSAEITPSLEGTNSPDPGKIVLDGKFIVTDFAGFTNSNLVGASITPSFNTSESLFLEALDNNQIKGIWIPGEHVARQNPTAGNFTPDWQKTAPMIKKRYLLFVSANLVQ